MDTATKLKEMIEDAKAEAARQIRLADDLTEALKRATNGAATAPLIPPRLKIKNRDTPLPKSMLRTAVAVLGEHHGSMHINDLVSQVSKRRGKLVPRPSLESVLAIAVKKGKFGLKRTAPGTFEVEK